MIEFLRKLFRTGGGKTSSRRPEVRSQTPRTNIKKAASKTPPKTVELEPKLSGKVISNGPGKNVLIPAPQGTGRRTDGSLGTVDDPADELSYDAGEKTGIDPYNTGNFDRSKNWDKRHLK